MQCHCWSFQQVQGLGDQAVATLQANTLYAATVIVVQRLGEGQLGRRERSRQTFNGRLTALLY